MHAYAVDVPLAHVTPPPPGAQPVPALQSSHVRLPLHLPVVLHVLADVVAHSAAEVPDGTAEHVPTAPARLHASQGPPHAVSQHTLSTQLPLAHVALDVHATPNVAGTHALPEQR